MKRFSEGKHFYFPIVLNITSTWIQKNGSVIRFQRSISFFIFIFSMHAISHFSDDVVAKVLTLDIFL